MLQGRRENGFTLIELVITVAVLAILTLGVIPLVQVSVKRQKEEQLRASLREMREAIDQFHREALAGAQMQTTQTGGNRPDPEGRGNQPLPNIFSDPRVRVYVSDPTIIRLFIDRGADVLTGYPIAKGLIHATRLFLGIYKSYIGKYPQLQSQADMALRHFCEKGNLRGVSLLMWLGANPRAKAPSDADESEECWRTPLAAAASGGQLDVIKRLKPDPAKDDLNDLLRESLFQRNMELVRYWISLGADINHVDADRDTAHRHVFWSLTWAIDRRDCWYSNTHGADAKRFAQEWFSSGAKWQPKGDDFRTIRKAFSLLSYMEVYEFIKLFREKDVMPGETLLREMGAFNEELVKAGVMLAGEGIHPSHKGKRVRFSGGTKTVTDGPFPEKEVVAGFWIWQVKSMEEALDWVGRCPDPMPGEDAEIEIRPIFEAEDFGNEFTPELRAQEERLRADVERRRRS